MKLLGFLAMLKLAFQLGICVFIGVVGFIAVPLSAWGAWKLWSWMLAPPAKQALMIDWQRVKGIIP